MRRRLTIIGIGLGIVMLTAAWGLWAAEASVDVINAVWSSGTGDDYAI